MQRTVHFDVVNWGPRIVITYAKFSGLILTGFINVEKRRDFRDARIHVKNGVLSHGRISFPQQLWSYVNDKADVTKKIKQKMSQKQKEKINADYRKLSLDEIIASGTFQALQRDIEIFNIEEVFSIDADENGSEPKVD